MVVHIPTTIRLLVLAMCDFCDRRRASPEAKELEKSNLENLMKLRTAEKIKMIYNRNNSIKRTKYLSPVALPYGQPS